MVSVLVAVLQVLYLLLLVYVAGALAGAWTFFAVPVSFRP